MSLWCEATAINSGLCDSIQQRLPPNAQSSRRLRSICEALRSKCCRPVDLRSATRICKRTDPKFRSWTVSVWNSEKLRTAVRWGMTIMHIVKKHIRGVRGTTYSPTASISRWSVIFRQAWAQAVLATHWASNSEICSTTWNATLKCHDSCVKETFVDQCWSYIWVNYNISLTWIKAIWGWFPLLAMIPGFGRSEVVIKFTQIIYDPKIPMDTNPKRTGVALVSISNPAGILESGLKRQKKHQRCIQKLHSGKLPREVPAARNRTNQLDTGHNLGVIICIDHKLGVVPAA